jgi:trimethylamine--corrinoid protein Co-methyltransferase
MTGDVSERNAMHTGICDLWSDEALDAIEGAAFELLLRAGVKVPSAAVRELMLGVGCTLGDADRVRVPAEAVRDALAACPRQFTQAARDPIKDLAVDPDPGIVYVHNTGETAVLLDPLTGQSRPSTFTDQVGAARVMHQLGNLHSINPPLSPQDVPGPLVPLFSYLALVSESDKHIGGPGVSLAIQVEYLLKMASVVLGDAEARGSHRLSLYLSPVSPMQLGGEVSEGLVVAARAGAVCQILPAPTAGTTAPVPLAAALAQQHAEVLAAVIVAQAVNPGTPCIYGPRLQASDPRTGTAVWGMPVLGLSAAGGTLLARRVGLAADCYGLATDAKVVDAQNGYERAINGLLGAMARPRYLSGVGSLDSVAAISLEQIEIDDEIMGYLLYAIEERPWDTEALDVDAMVEGSLKGNFLGIRQTRKYLRREACPTSISYHGGLQEWLTTGRTSVLEPARQRLQEHLAAEPIGLPVDVESQLCGLIDEAGREIGLGEWPDPRRLLDEARETLAR